MVDLRILTLAAALGLGLATPAFAADCYAEGGECCEEAAPCCDENAPAKDVPARH